MYATDSTLLSTTSLNLTGSVATFTDTGEAKPIGAVTLSDLGGWSGIVQSVTYNASPVPVPATLLLFGPGLVGLAAIRRRFKK